MLSTRPLLRGIVKGHVDLRQVPNHRRKQFLSACLLDRGVWGLGGYQRLVGSCQEGYAAGKKLGDRCLWRSVSRWDTRAQG